MKRQIIFLALSLFWLTLASYGQQLAQWTPEEAARRCGNPDQNRLDAPKSRALVYEKRNVELLFAKFGASWKLAGFLDATGNIIDGPEAVRRMPCLKTSGIAAIRNKKTPEILPENVYAISQPVRHVALEIAQLLNEMRDDLDKGGPFSEEFKVHEKLTEHLVEHLRISELKHGDHRIFLCLDRGYYLTSQYATTLATESLKKVDSKAAQALPPPITGEGKLSVEQMRNVMVKCTVAIDSMVETGETDETWRCDPKRVNSTLPSGFDEALPKSSQKQ